MTTFHGRASRGDHIGDGSKQRARDGGLLSYGAESILLRADEVIE
jgi:hypothetical protein